MAGKRASDALNDLPAVSVRRPYLAAVLNLLIVLAGIAALFGVEIRELPDVDRPVVTVRADFPGASPETLDAEVTNVIEGAVARVGGVVDVRSASEEDNLRVHVTFNPSVDLAQAAADVREAVSRVESKLPDGVENLTVIKADSDAYPIISLAVSSDSLAIDDLTRVVDNQVVPALTSVDGVAEVNMFGDRDRVLRVKLDPLKLASYGLSVADVAKVMETAHYDVPAGSYQSDQQEVLVRANASVTQPQQIERLYLRDNVRLGDVASVFYAPADAQSWVRLNGRQIISLGVVRQAGSNTVAIADAVTREAARLNAGMRNIHIEVVSDDSRFIKSAVGELLRTLGYTILIVVAVIAVFTGQLRSSIIPTLAIPVALIGSIAAVWLFGFSLNLITLLAMILATGVVVDDAIVVLENTQRLRGEGVKSSAAAVLGTRQVFFAVVATSATLVSVFVPISFIPSQAGRLFREFGFVLAVTVAISSFVALTLVPMLVSKLPDRAPDSARRRPNAVRRALNVVGNGLKGLYARSLEVMLRHPMIALLICVAVVATAWQAYGQLKEELVPPEDRGQIAVRLTGPDGVGLAYTDRQVAYVEDVLRPYVDRGVAKRLYSITGRYDLNRGQVNAPLVDWSKRTLSEGEIARAVNRKLDKLPGAEARVRRGNSLNLHNADGGLQMALIGDNYDNIYDETKRFVQAIQNTLPWIQGIDINYRATQPQLSISIDRERATNLGVSIGDLATTIQVLVDQYHVADVVVDDHTVPVILQATEGAVKDPEDIGNLYVSATGGRLVPLTQLVTFHEDSIASELDRDAQRRAIEFSADIADGHTLGDAVDAVRALAHEKLGPDVSLIFRGEAQALQQTSHELAVTYVIALVVVFLVLVAQFESLISALVIMLTVPLGICAAIFALYLTGNSLNIYSQIGVLMLIGIVAKNAILMVEFADQLRERGYSPLDAARQAALVRLRPIMMTKISTVIAGLPLILSTGAGSESRMAIGWVIFGGLGIAGMITLYVAPVLYSRIAGFSTPRNVQGETLEAELDAVGDKVFPEKIETASGQVAE